MKTLDRLKSRARGLKRELVAMALVVRDPRTPWLARVLVAGVLAYALSPIDLIPDFIQILGYLDDLILVPAGIALAIRLIPREVMADARAKADLLENQGKSALRYLGMALVITFWLILLAIVAYVAWGMFVKR
jgi:uncharacterized membrane protein YkvA (DUF1232 family)